MRNIIRALLNTVLRWFGRREPEPEQEPVATAPRVKRKYKKRKKLQWGSFKKLKGHIDHVFDELDKSDYINSDGISINVTKDTIMGLRRVGPYMLDLLAFETADRTFMQSDKRPSPAIAFLGFGEALHNTGNDSEYLTYRFIFASKVGKKPFRFHLERVSKDEEIYEIGCAIYDTDPPRWARRSKHKLSWVSNYAALNKKTGVTRTLAHRARVQTRFYSRVCYTKPTDNGSLAEDDILARILNTWIQRDWHWQVQAKHANKRVTFCIEDNMAKDYFKDRQIDDNGVKKRIFHWVKSHYRVTKAGKMTTVKTHSRGNRHFTWGRYAIQIVIPGLHKHMLSEFDLEGNVLTDEQVENSPVALMTLEKAYGRLDEEKVTRK